MYLVSAAHIVAVWRNGSVNAPPEARVIAAAVPWIEAITVTRAVQVGRCDGDNTNTARRCLRGNKHREGKSDSSCGKNQ
jgi:hypothetical protein